MTISDSNYIDNLSTYFNKVFQDGKAARQYNDDRHKHTENEWKLNPYLYPSSEWIHWNRGYNSKE